MTSHKIVISQAAILTGLGDLETTWQGLLEGRSALKSLKIGEDYFPYPVAQVPDLNFPLGRKMRLQALLNKLWIDLPPLPEETALIVSTTKGAVDELLHSSDPRTLESQPWQLGDEIAHTLKLRGPKLVVSGACASGTLAVIQGAIWVLGKALFCLVVGIDILSLFVLVGFKSLNSLDEKLCKPFDRFRRGLSLGEAAGYLILTTSERAKALGWPFWAEIVSWGISCDAKHITAPCREGSGLKRAIWQATKHNTLPVGGINAHGTGTIYNDAMEVAAFKSVWEKNIPPFHSVKGALGHCLGAAGVIEMAIAVKSLVSGVLPPTVGLSEPLEKGFPISGKESLPLKEPSILCCNSGFGGVNAAVLIKAI